MKNILMFLLVSLLLLQSCTEEESNDLKGQLAAMKSTRDSLNAEIEKIEAKLSVNEVKTVAVEVLKLKKSEFTKYVNMQSVVYSDRNSNLSTKMAGVVTKVNVEPGDFVKEGQILIELDNSIQLRRLAEAKNRFEFIETIYNKQKSIWDKKVGSEIEYLKAKNDYETMQKSIALIEEEIDMLKLKAPFSGTVDMVNAKIGEAISPGLGAIMMSSASNLEARTEFPENYFNYIKKGMDVIISFPDLDAEPQNLKITSISEAINSKNRTMTAITKLPSIKDVKSNMTCVAKFAVYRADSTIVVPVNLVQKDKDRYYVFVADKDKKGNSISTKRYVTLGEDYNDKVEILSGLKEGDLMITYGINDVKENSSIEVSQVVENSNY